MSASTRTELQNTLIKSTPFSPRRAIRRLVKAETTGSKTHVLIKTWELARLFGWVVLDQRPGTRQSKAKASDNNKASKRRIRKSNARRAGDIALAWLLDDIFEETRKRRSNEDGEDLAVIIALIKSRGGFSNLAEGRGSKLLLSQAARRLSQLGYVYQVIDFLCRYKDHNPDSSKFNVKAAYYFVEKQQHEDLETHGKSRIEQIWLKYKDAAPYIYSFYECFSSRLAGAISINEVKQCIKNLASDHGRLTDMIGKAAHVADILSERKVRDVRVRDFANVARIRPSTDPFSEIELTIIANFDPEAP